MTAEHRSDTIRTTDVGGLGIAYADHGTGTPVILLHCSSASHREWSPLVPHLASRYRALAPDLVGYGRSDPWPARTPFDPLADVNVVLALADLAGEPVHLVGHSYGGATALEAARLLGDRALSLTLVEPVAFHVLALAGRTNEWAEVDDVARRIRTLVARGRARRAAAVYMGFWIGRPRWWFMPGRQRRAIVSTMRKVAAEFGIMRAIRTPLAEYAGMQVPTRIIVGGRTRSPARAVTEVLLDVMPDAHVRLVAEAGHMSPFTHRDVVFPMITAHLDACEFARPVVA